MGKALTIIGIWTFISMVAGIFIISMASLDPNSEMLAANALLGDSSMVKPYVTNPTDPINWGYANNMSGYKPTGSATGTGTSGTSYPDWINSSLNWISNIFGTLFNIVGAPYTLMMYMVGGSLAAVIGIGLSIINMFILVNWIFGKVD